MTGISLLALAGWVFPALFTAERPGRLLPGDTVDKFRPVQPPECVWLGMGPGGSGLLLVTLFPPGCDLTVLWRQRGKRTTGVLQTQQKWPNQPGPLELADGTPVTRGFPGQSLAENRSSLAAQGEHYGI